MHRSVVGSLYWKMVVVLEVMESAVVVVIAKAVLQSLVVTEVMVADHHCMEVVLVVLVVWTRLHSCFLLSLAAKWLVVQMVAVVVQMALMYLMK